MFPKLDPKLASSAYYIGDNLGLHKLIHTFFGTISSKRIFYGSKLGHAHPNINCFVVCGYFVIFVKEIKTEKEDAPT